MEYLKQAAEKMGLAIDESVKTIATSYGSYERNNGNVDGAFVKNGKQLQLGYVMTGEDGNFNVIGDFWSTGLNSETFIGTLGQLYQEINIQAQLELQGYTVERVETNAQGDTEIEAYCWA
jgi:hypothetical protein